MARWAFTLVMLSFGAAISQGQAPRRQVPSTVPPNNFPLISSNLSLIGYTLGSKQQAGCHGMSSGDDHAYVVDVVRKNTKEISLPGVSGMSFYGWLPGRRGAIVLVDKDYRSCEKTDPGHFPWCDDPASGCRPTSCTHGCYDDYFIAVGGSPGSEWSPPLVALGQGRADAGNIEGLKPYYVAGHLEAYMFATYPGPRTYKMFTTGFGKVELPVSTGTHNCSVSSQGDFACEMTPAGTAGLTIYDAQLSEKASLQTDKRIAIGRWSPKGDKLVYTTSDYHLAVWDRTTATTKTVAGDKLFFKGDCLPVGPCSARQFIASGTEQVSWSRDNRTIYFSVGEGDKLAKHLVLGFADTGKKNPRFVPLTGGKDADCSYASVAPDGRGVAFICKVDKPAPRESQIQIYWLNFRTRRIEQLTHVSNTEVVRSPQWQ